MSLYAFGTDGAAHGFAVEGQGTVRVAMVFVALPYCGAEVIRARPDQQVVDDFVLLGGMYRTWSSAA